jgi:hypothetical protein
VIAAVLGCAAAPPTEGSASETAHSAAPGSPTAETGGEPWTPPSTGETGVPTDPCASPGVHLGSGVTDHLPLAAGDPVTLVHGPQGGWHVDVSGWVVGTGQVVSVHPSLVRLSDGLALAGEQTPQSLALTATEPCGWEFWAVRAFVDDFVDPDPVGFVCSLAGEPLALTVEVVDLVSGLTLTDTVEVVGASDPLEVCP